MNNVKEAIDRANKSKVSLSKKQFVKEHEGLLKTLKSGKKKNLQREYEEQSSELRRVKHEGR